MKHGCQLNTQLTRRMNGHAELECLAYTGRFYALTNTTPERCVEQDHVDRRIEYIGGELLEVNDNSICGERHAHLFACAAHAVEAIDRVLKIVVVDVLD